MADGSRSFNFQLPNHARAKIAVGLRAACHRPRDRVEVIDLIAMEVAA